MTQAETRDLRRKKAKLESCNRAKSSSSTMSFKASGQTASANAFHEGPEGEFGSQFPALK